MEENQARRTGWRIETQQVHEVSVGRIPSFGADRDRRRPPHELPPEGAEMRARDPPCRAICMRVHGTPDRLLKPTAPGTGATRRAPEGRSAPNPVIVW